MSNGNEVDIRRYAEKYVEVEIEESWPANDGPRNRNNRDWKLINAMFTPGDTVVDFRMWKSAGSDIDGYSITEEVEMELDRESVVALREVLDLFLEGTNE